MATKNPRLKAGLATLGLIWSAASPAGAQQAADVTPLPAALPPAGPTNAPAFAVLLLSNGRIQQGVVSDDPANQSYVLHAKGGTILIPKKGVERRFASIGELYEYKAGHLPDRDPDERMKLALWCLQHGMNPEARQQLQGVLAINPKDDRARRMVASMDANATIAGARDPDVRAAGAEVVESVPRDQVPMPRGRSGGKPVVFDLATAVAAKRATEFAWYVHPVLQAACASCHGDSYPGNFRLVSGRSRRDWTADLVRANLDATLRLVNRDEPSRSELFVAATTPHGNAAKPLFNGPNDPRQRTLGIWVASLKSTGPIAARPGLAPAPTAAFPGAPAEAFGVERMPGSTLPALPTSAGLPATSMPPSGQPIGGMTVPIPAPGMPDMAKVDVQSFEAAVRGATGSTFPVSPLQGGPVAPGGGFVPPPDDVIPPTKRPKKASKVDNELLEKVMTGRQAAPQP